MVPGLIFKSVKIFSKRLNALGVQCFPHAEVLSASKTDGYINGAVIYTPNSELKYIKSKVVVLAAGSSEPYSNIHLDPEDVFGMGQYLALKAGGKLINLEFIQMMQGASSPPLEQYSMSAPSVTFKWNLQAGKISSIIHMKSSAFKDSFNPRPYISSAFIRHRFTVI